VTFYDAEDLEIGADVRSGESFSFGEVREFPVDGGGHAAASVIKALLTITKVPINMARDNIATLINEQGFIKVVPPNTPRFTHDPVTLEPLGLLLEPGTENLISQSDITQWTRFRVTVTAYLSAFGDPVYLIKGNGASLQHNIVLPYPIVATPAQRTLSSYMTNVENIFAQLAIGSDPNVFANFDLELGVLGANANVASSIIPAGDGWYRCTMTITSALGVSFLLYLTTAANVVRAQGNKTSGAIFFCFPQMELGPIATSYMPTNGTSVTRAADIVQNTLSLSTFRRYGSRDFTGALG
jgi:hypothetical protein